MTAVTIVGIIAGCVLVVTAVVIFLAKKEFPTGGVMITAIGLILIGMSQWSSITLSGMGIEIKAMRQEIAQTAAAADEVAAQAEQAAAGIEATKEQLTSLTHELDTRQVLPVAVTEMIRARLSTVRNVDVSKLNAARTDLKAVIRR
jgi:hypothetical protein